MKARTLFLSALALPLVGCQIPQENFSIQSGFRRASGTYMISNERRNIPLLRISRTETLTENIEGETYLDLSRGSFNFEDSGLDHAVGGTFGAVGTKAQYFPFQKYVSLDLGGEIFTVEMAGSGRAGPFEKSIRDTAFGWGVNTGMSGHIPLGGNVSCVLSGGYNFTDSCSNRVGFDFDGPYAFVGLQFSFEEKKRR